MNTLKRLKMNISKSLKVKTLRSLKMNTLRIKLYRTILYNFNCKIYIRDYLEWDVLLDETYQRSY